MADKTKKYRYYYRVTVRETTYGTSRQILSQVFDRKDGYKWAANVEQALGMVYEHYDDPPYDEVHHLTIYEHDIRGDILFKGTKDDGETIVDRVKIPIKNEDPEGLTYQGQYEFGSQYNMPHRSFPIPHSLETRLT